MRSTGGRSRLARLRSPARRCVAGCGSGDSDPATSAARSARRRPRQQRRRSRPTRSTIADFNFDPQTISVKAGTEVTWTNSDDATHTATADDGSFDTGDLDKGDSKSVTFDKAGSFTYYCRFHPFMKATVEVQ